MNPRCSLQISLLLALAGCGKTSDGTASETGTPDPGPTCDTTVSSTDPTNGSMDHFYRDPIVFNLSEPDTSALVLTDIVGETRFEDGGATVVFTPEGNLSASTEYTVSLDYCFGEPSITFTTSHYGSPLEASADLEGRTYSIAFGTGEYTTGENAGDLLNALFTRPVLIQLQDVDGPYLDVLTALGRRDVEPPEQDTCARTIELNHVSMNDLPRVSGGVEDFEFGAQGGQLRFASLAFEGTISSDASSIGGIAYEAVMGVDEIVDLLPEFGNLYDVCSLAENLGIPCSPCPGDAGLDCISFAAKGVRADLVDASLVPITEAGTHEDCVSSD